MIKIFKNLLLILFLLNIHQQVQAKPIPPGSGEGDVPANILFLIDSSASMQRMMNNRDAIEGTNGFAVDNDGNYLINQSRRLGIVKFFSADGTRDRSYNGNVGRFRGGNLLCANVSNGSGYSPGTINIVANHTAEMEFADDISTNGGATTEDVYFFRTADRRAIIGISEDGKDCRFYIPISMTLTQGVDVVKVGTEHFLFVTGRWGRTNRFQSVNLSTGQSSSQNFGRRGSWDSVGRCSRDSWWNAVTSDASMMYLECRRHLHGYALTRNGATYQVTGGNARPTERFNSVSRGNLDTQLAPVQGFEISPEDDDILVIASRTRNVIQKVELTSATTLTVIARAGTGALEYTRNTEDAGTLAASSVRLNRPGAITITEDEILVGSPTGIVDVFNENLFNADNKDTAWVRQFGGGNMSRWAGVKQAINAVLADTTLTTGAHFGYGHWNSGESGRAKKSHRGGWQCHARLNNCQYYLGWTGGVHPEGRSLRCNSDSCLNVAISPEGYTKIPRFLNPQGLAWGTDANAFAQMALRYYTDPNTDVIDEDSDCQLNYVIVIGDGAWKNHSTARPLVETLRKSHGVKSIMVAYGGGISGGAMRNFDRMAIAGSCDDATGNDTECIPTIVADTAEELKTELTARIRQILAERLSFTAPSITATVEKGGSLYQAQFAYEQMGEWQGTILRKTLTKEGEVIHEMTEPGNWDASVEIKKQSTPAGTEDTRNIWSAIEDATYIGNWDNFNVDNSAAIESMFIGLGYQLTDYHNANSNCAVGENGTADELEGLINFMKGTDYFDYDGDCNITEVRGHVLGDIYHSQLIEIGPPDANFQFTDTNQESYFRATNNYQGFIAKQAARRRIVYAGSNAGMLHALNAATGKEEWAFIPPFIAGLLPGIINPALDGRVDGSKGGSNAIFGVDGSPVVHDVFIKGINEEGNFEDQKRWHTLLIIPYGRGGAGFSILDVTNPILKEGKGPIHMVSIFNDSINSRVLVADHQGDVQTYSYSAGKASITDSLEAKQANQNAIDARDADDAVDPTGELTPTLDGIATCQTNAQAASGIFSNDGTNTCYIGPTFTFDMAVPTTDGVNVPLSSLTITEFKDGELKKINIKEAKMQGGQLILTFPEDKIYKSPDSSDVETRERNYFSIATSCTASAGIDPIYDYSQLGETWSEPRVFRIPSKKLGEREDSVFDRYVAVMGGGMGSTNLCAGSAVFIVDIEDQDNPGSIYAADVNSGPITIIDTDPTGLNTAAGLVETPNGSDIGNALPSSAVVVTPDTAPGIPWRGGMVYFNDLEGKITKINLTNSTQNNADMFDQTTLFNLRANTTNHRYSYFSMDAGIGADTNNFWLFGGTGNFTDIGSGDKFMDNILYGVKDVHYPYFAHLNSVTVPRENSDSFLSMAAQGAENALSVEDAAICKDVTGDYAGLDCPTADEMAWVIHLDTVDGLPAAQSANTYRKISAPPTLFKGHIYFPVYQPPAGANKCNIGKAFICAADDECGSNTSHELTLGGAPTGKECLFVREGILSELVIFGDTLYANVAGPKEDADTLYSVLAAPGEIDSSRSNWRESDF